MGNVERISFVTVRKLLPNWFTLDLDVFRGASFVHDQAVVKPTARGGNEAKQQRKTPNIK
jgi:hypothetical protein